MEGSPGSPTLLDIIPANAPVMFDANEQLFSSAFAHAPIGMSLIAPDLRCLRVNAAFCRMLGYTMAEMLARTVKDISHPDDAAVDLAYRTAMLEGSLEHVEREKRYLHKDGHVVWGHLSCTLVRHADGRPLHFISQVQDITERRQAQEQLRRSEARFRSLTELSSDWYWEQDSDFRFVNFSGEARQDSSRPDPLNPLGLPRWEIPGAQPLGTTWELHRGALARHESFRDFQYVRPLPDGRLRYISASGEPTFAEDGRFTGYRGTARDITESKQAEQRLHDMQGMLHMAAQVGRLGGWAWEVGQARVVWSDEVCAIHEVQRGFRPTPEEAVDFFAPEHREAMRRHVLASARQGTAFDTEAQILTAKGRRLWVRVICEPEWDATGRVRKIHGACQDISEARAAAEQARVMAEQLTATLESLTDAFMTVDREWRFTYLNTEAENLLRTPRGQLLRQRVWEVLPQFRATRVQRLLERAMNLNVTVQFEEHYEPTGTWVQVKAHPSKQGLAVDVKDVTERVRAQREIMRLNTDLEERVRQRTAELEEANRELEAFSYSIAHDLRAPLSSIDGFSQMLDSTAGAGLPERSKHYLARIRAGVRQMGDLTDGLLSLAHFSRARLRSDAVDLAVMARATIAQLRERHPAREVDVDVASALPARGDPRLLQQVLDNLVGNAWKFTARRTDGRIEVVGAPGADGEWVYTVRDNGAGFDMTYATRMFEAFQRMHAASEFEGTGIGLAIVHKIVARHNGRIWAEAAPGQGAAFHFTLGAA